MSESDPAKMTVRNPQECCEGVLSGYVDPAGVPARMCDDNCACWSCVMCRTFE